MFVDNTYYHALYYEYKIVNTITTKNKEGGYLVFGAARDFTEIFWLSEFS